MTDLKKITVRQKRAGSTEPDSDKKIHKKKKVAGKKIEVASKRNEKLSKPLKSRTLQSGKPKSARPSVIRISKSRVNDAKSSAGGKVTEGEAIDQEVSWESELAHAKGIMALRENSPKMSKTGEQVSADINFSEERSNLLDAQRTVLETIKKPRSSKVMIIDEETSQIKNAPMGAVNLQTADNSHANPKSSHQPLQNIVDLSKDSKAKSSGIPVVSTIPAVKSKKPLALYWRMAFAFILLAIVFVGVFFYTSFVKVTIFITPSQEKVVNNMEFEVSETPESSSPAQGVNESMTGRIASVQINETKSFPATGEKTEEGEAVSEVIIRNNYIKNQPLVASTRLLTQDNKLFRIKYTVNVPAGGNIRAEIYADDPKDLPLPASTRFTIPGLWAGLQDKIYAETVASGSDDVKKIKYVSEADIENTRKSIKDLLSQKITAELSAKEPGYDKVLYLIDDNLISVTFDASAGDEKEAFSATISAPVKTVYFSSAKAQEMIKTAYQSKIPIDKELMTLNSETIQYSLSSCDVAEKKASVKASFEANIAFKGNAEIIDKKQILNLSKAQLEDYLKQKSEISAYRMEFYPSFVKRVPNLIDRVTVEVKR